MMMHSTKFHYQSLFPVVGLCAMLVLPGPLPAQGATYYVAQATGNDANPGTLNQPFKTIAMGVQPLVAGDTLYIRSGTYTEQVDLHTKTGAPGNYITIAGYPGERPILQYADPGENYYGIIKVRGERGYFIFENLVLDGVLSTNHTNWALRDGNHDFILRNLEIKNTKGNGLYIQADNISVINCKIHDLISVSGKTGERWYGIYVRFGNNILIEGNEFYNAPGGGLQLYPGPISKLVVRNNIIHHNNRLADAPIGGIILQGTSTAPISDTEIYNNVVYNNGTPTSGNAPGIQIGIHTNNTKVWNNTVHGNKSYGIHIGYDNTTTNTIVQNNISYGNMLGDY
ncbi:MAG: right-handed parallel beta-helix repeat-containing protein, partial [Nitrospira sp.]